MRDTIRIVRKGKIVELADQAPGAGVPLTAGPVDQDRLLDPVEVQVGPERPGDGRLRARQVDRRAEVRGGPVLGRERRGERQKGEGEQKGPETHGILTIFANHSRIGARRQTDQG